MTIAKQMDIRNNIKYYFDMAFDGDTILVPRKENKNVVISQKEYEDLQKMKRNAEYLTKIDESIENHKKGDTISFTMEELRAMESEDWKPTEKILEFEKKHGIQRNEENEK